LTTYIYIERARDNRDYIYIYIERDSIDYIDREIMLTMCK